MNEIKFKTCLLVFALIWNLGGAAFAQFDFIQFESDSDEYSSDVVATEDGNYVGLTIDIDNGESQLHLFKFASDGTTIWDRYFQHPNLESVSSYRLPDIIRLNDGGLAILYTNEDPNGADKFTIVIKVDDIGGEVWRKEFECCFYDLLERPNDEIWLGGDVEYQPTGQDLRLKKLDSSGNEILNWDYSYTSDGVDAPEEGFHISINTADEIILSGMRNLSNSEKIHFRIAQDGTLLNELEFGNTNQTNFDHQVISTPDGGSMYITSYYSEDFYSISKIDGEGELVWIKEINIGEHQRDYNDLIAWNGGAIAVGSIRYFGSFSEIDALVTFIDGDGNVINDFVVDYEGNRENLFSVIPDNEEGLLFFGQVAIPDGPSESNLNPFIFGTDSLGNLFDTYLTGQVFHDLNADCVIDSGEPAFDDYRLSLEGASVYTYSFSGGTYSFGVDPGTYTLSATPISYFWEHCSESETVTVEENETVETDFLAQGLVDCSLMSVQHGSGRMRVCRENVFEIEYCNLGTIAEDDAYIELVIDPALEILSATLAYTEVDDIYTFEIPDPIGINECGTFEVTMFLNCDTEIGTAICTDVHIFPDSLCLLDSLWSGASVSLTAECDDAEVLFKLENVGSSTTSVLDFIIIEDQVVLNTGTTILEPGEEEIIPVQANNATITMFADQEPNHPGLSMPMASVENCDDMGSLGYVTMFPPDDADYAIDIECKEAVNSFDPNKKDAYTKGIGDDHLLAANTDIEYVIYFQNTGNDVAYNVRLADTLSPHLNPLSIRPNSSSHNYDWSLSGEGVLQFFFNDINLPDSMSNPDGSQGWVKYRISQKEDVEIGTLIENRAGIYFDLNPPIITNTVFHNIGEDYIVTSIETIDVLPDYKVDVFPNPFKTEATLRVQHESFHEGILKVVNVNGQIVYETKVLGQDHLLDLGSLPSGIYFLQLFNEKQLTWSGKAIIQK